MSWQTTRVVSWQTTRVVSWQTTRVVSWQTTRVVGWQTTRVVSWQTARVVSWQTTRVVSGQTTRVVSWQTTRVVSWQTTRVVSWQTTRVVSWQTTRVGKLLELANRQLTPWYTRTRDTYAVVTSVTHVVAAHEKRDDLPVVVVVDVGVGLHLIHQLPGLHWYVTAEEQKSLHCLTVAYIP